MDGSSVIGFYYLESEIVLGPFTAPGGVRQSPSDGVTLGNTDLSGRHAPRAGA